jgi:hypothetical protein
MRNGYFLKSNVLMDDCCQELDTFMNSDSNILCNIAILSEVLLSNIVIHKGCYLLEFALPKDIHPEPEADFAPDDNFPDRTGYECFKNHIHTMDILEDSQKGLHHLLTGIIIAEHLRYKLKSIFPFQIFRIIVSYPVLPITKDDAEIKNDCTVRFHSVRDNEIIYENLDDYQFDAIGIIQV